MSEVMWIRFINEGIPLVLLVGLGVVLYQGFKKNQALLSEREDLLKRYLLFRGDKQVRLSTHGSDQKVYQELLKNFSNSWKNFKRTYDQCLLSLAHNTVRTKHVLQLITLGLLLNSLRLLGEEYFFYGFKARFLYALTRELSTYVLVFISFFLLRSQTQKVLSLTTEAAKMEREILFFSTQSAVQEHGGLYDEFDPLEPRGAEDGEED